VLDLVLRPSRLQRLGEVAPEPIQPRVGHLEDPADVVGTALVQEGGGLGGIAVAALGTVPVPLQEPRGDERVEEVVDPARMKPQPIAYLRAGQHLVAELREQLQLDRRQQHLRRPEPHAHLHDVGWI
jgi:hypothetical protein